MCSCKPNTTVLLCRRCVHFRGPLELGGIYFFVNALKSVASWLVAAALYSQFFRVVAGTTEVGVLTGMDTSAANYSGFLNSTGANSTAANDPTVAKSGRSPIFVACMMAPAAVVEAWLEMPCNARRKSGYGTCGIGSGGVCARGVEEAGVVGRRSVHAGDNAKVGRPGGEVPRVESGGDEPRGDALQRVDEEVNAAQFQRSARLNTPAAQQTSCYLRIGMG